jgi:hypothetical protein
MALVVAREQEYGHQVRLAQRHADAAQSALAAAEAELQRLTGDPVTTSL